MKTAAFQELLESVRDTGAYLKGSRKAVVRTDRVSPQSVAAIRAKMSHDQRARLGLCTRRTDGP